MRKRDLVRLLLGAAAVMPATERRKFGQLVKGRRALSRPGDGLPPITLDRDAPKERRRRGLVHTPDQFRQLGLF